MGKVRYIRATKSRRYGLVRLWLMPIIVVGAIVFVVNLTFADVAPPPTELQQYLQTSELIPHSEIVDGYQQIYYLYNKQKVFVTTDKINHTNPKSKGKYMVWLGSSNSTPSQVYLYNVLTNTTLQLSSVGTNIDPDIDNGHVVWQQWVSGKWQVMYYDGLQVNQISSVTGDALRPRILGERVVYVTRAADDNVTPWHIVEYNTQTQHSSLVLATAEATKSWPHFSRSGQLTTEYDLEYLGN